MYLAAVILPLSAKAIVCLEAKENRRGLEVCILLQTTKEKLEYWAGIVHVWYYFKFRNVCSLYKCR